MKKRLIYVSVSLLLLFNKNLHSQNLSNNLSKVIGEYAQSYLQPFINVFGSAVNSGFYNSADIISNRQNSFHISIGIKTIGAFVPGNEKMFSSVYYDTIMYNYYGREYPVSGKATVKNAPTIFGSGKPGNATIKINDTLYVEGLLPYYINETKQEKTIGGLVTADIAPLIIPQIGAGTYFGTDIFIRWLPSFKLGSYGNSSFFGAGIEHNLNMYLPDLPVNVEFLFAYQNMGITDTTGNRFINLNTFALNALVNKNFGVFNIYGALQFEWETLIVNYKYVPQNSGNNIFKMNINFNLNGINRLRFVTGISATFGLFNINMDYNFAKISSISMGLNFDIL